MANFGFHYLGGSIVYDSCDIVFWILDSGFRIEGIARAAQALAPRVALSIGKGRIP
ncbi:hypothetical protein D1AOALGA4SA_3554 [Olavius algarvensis Delta 1 endosymbiont]|nr:hypothetical protein D1AOALGA4SA_3554 [Olavius algarvensis Delta 1 endosymbiont]